MRCERFRAGLALLANAAFAQAPATQTPPPAPSKPGLFSRMFHPKPKQAVGQMHPGMTPRPGMMSGHSMAGGAMASGQIVGNKNSHVYHLPGGKGAMPAPQNRVYFPNAAAAEAAGYHAAGGGRGTMIRR